VLAGAHPELAYRERAQALRDAGIALWDVLASCERVSSLDADIKPVSRVPNDFLIFFTKHPRITNVLFNGATAEACYRRLVLPGVADLRLAYVRLPSTSPAHAGMSHAQKLAAWAGVLGHRRKRLPFSDREAVPAADQTALR
jgi:hypoxanthine-DNA glycosylase